MNIEKDDKLLACNLSDWVIKNRNGCFKMILFSI